MAIAVVSSALPEETGVARAPLPTLDDRHVHPCLSPSANYRLPFCAESPPGLDRQPGSDETPQLAVFMARISEGEYYRPRLGSTEVQIQRH